MPFETTWEVIKRATGWKHYSELAKFLGIKSASLSGAKQRGHMPVDWLFKISQDFDLSLDYLVYMVGPPHLNVKRYHSPDKVDALGYVKDLHHTYAVRTDQDDFIYVPMMRGKISAGGGLVPDNAVDMTVAFQREWLNRKGDPLRMSVIRVQGDSMSPTLLAGDIVLVNHNVQSVTVNGGIYAIAFKDEIMIKRIEVVFPAGNFHVVSDNKEYRAFDADPSQVIINGKVVWYGRDLER